MLAVSRSLVLWKQRMADGATQGLMVQCMQRRPKARSSGIRPSQQLPLNFAPYMLENRGVRLRALAGMSYGPIRAWFGVVWCGVGRIAQKQERVVSVCVSRCLRRWTSCTACMPTRTARSGESVVGTQLPVLPSAFAPCCTPTSCKSVTVSGPNMDMLVAAWYKLALAAEEPKVLPHVVDMLKSQGRMKYLRPLYRALYRSKMGKQMATETFQEARDSYHPIAQKMVAVDLELA
eukprot:351361-Chlamydomonas_euryale.AAC.1